MSRIDNLTRLQGHIRNLIAMRKRQAKLSEKSYTDLSPKQAQKLATDQTWLGMEIDKAEREAHAAAVDCGLADARPASHYEPVDYRPSAFHHYRHTPTKPECL